MLQFIAHYLVVARKVCRTVVSPTRLLDPFSVSGSLVFMLACLPAEYYGKVGLRGAGLSLWPLPLLTRRDRLRGLIACNQSHPLQATSHPLHQPSERSTVAPNKLGRLMFSTPCTASIRVVMCDIWWHKYKVLLSAAPRMTLWQFSPMNGLVCKDSG